MIIRMKIWTKLVNLKKTKSFQVICNMDPYLVSNLLYPNLLSTSFASQVYCVQGVDLLNSTFATLNPSNYNWWSPICSCLILYQFSFNLETLLHYFLALFCQIRLHNVFEYATSYFSLQLTTTYKSCT